jgi:hypothetical protein
VISWLQAFALSNAARTDRYSAFAEFDEDAMHFEIEGEIPLGGGFLGFPNGGNGGAVQVEFSLPIA